MRCDVVQLTRGLYGTYERRVELHPGGPMMHSSLPRRHVPHALALLLFAGVVGCGSMLPGSNGAGGTGGHGPGGGSGAAGGSQGHGGAGGIGGPCWATSACVFGICAGPGQQVCGGICVIDPPACMVDSDCSAIDASWSGPSICGPVPCSCGTPMGCQPGCTTDADCSTGQSCGSDHHCSATACATGATCPVDFTCSSGRCARKTCTSDSDCSASCVEGACYGMPGTCVGLTV